MKYKISSILTFTFSLFLISNALAQKHGIENSQLDQPYDTMIEAYKSLDADMLKQVYHESAVYLSPSRGQKIQEGLPSFISGFEGMFSNAKEKNEDLVLSFKIVKREQRNNMAVDVGYYKLEVKKNDQVLGTSYGKFVTLLTKDNRSSSWKFEVDGYSASPAVEF